LLYDVNEDHTHQDHVPCSLAHEHAPELHLHEVLPRYTQLATREPINQQFQELLDLLDELVSLLHFGILCYPDATSGVLARRFRLRLEFNSIETLV
jgi:hypothetical protein